MAEFCNSQPHDKPVGEGAKLLVDELNDSGFTGSNFGVSVVKWSLTQRQA